MQSSYLIDQYMQKRESLSICGVMVRIIHKSWEFKFNAISFLASMMITVDGGTNRWLQWLRANKLEGKLKPPNFITGDLDSCHLESLGKKIKFINLLNKLPLSLRILQRQEQSDTHGKSRRN